MRVYPFFHGASGDTFGKARELRKSMTMAEQELWKHIRKNQLDGFRFRRQHPVAQFILDFYCHDSKLAIEVDGLIHDQRDQKLYDQERDIVIHELGVKVIRFKNEDIFQNLPEILTKIRSELKARSELSIKSSPLGEDSGGVKTTLNS